MARQDVRLRPALGPARMVTRVGGLHRGCKRVSRVRVELAEPPPALGLQIYPVGLDPLRRAKNHRVLSQRLALNPGCKGQSRDASDLHLSEHRVLGGSEAL